MGQCGDQQVPDGGKEQQPKTNWLDYGARMYDPALGRWLVMDPMTDTQESFSPYHYVYDNPILHTDPDGRAPCCGGVSDFLFGALAAIAEDNLPVASNYVASNGSRSYQTGATAGHLVSAVGGALETIAGLGGDVVAGVAEIATGGGATPLAVPLAAGSTSMVLHGASTFTKAVYNLNSGGNNSEPGKRRGNRIDDFGTPNTVVSNKPGTTIKKYGPDGIVQKEFNKGHQGKNVPKNEKNDHIHDHKPKPDRHPNDPQPTDRQGGRPPKKGELKKDFEQ